MDAESHQAVWPSTDCNDSDYLTIPVFDHMTIPLSKETDNITINPYIKKAPPEQSAPNQSKIGLERL